MRVEIRQRPSAGASLAGIPPPKRAASSAATPGLVEAYSESCFENSTSFYIAPPEHPKLGKWAQPSSLKYSQPLPQQDHVAAQCLDEAMHFASNRGGRRSKRSGGRPRTTGGESYPRPVLRGGDCHPSTREKSTSSAAVAAKSSARAKPSRALGSHSSVEPGRAKRPISPVGALLTASTTSPSAIQGQREAPRINTPISGRVRVNNFVLWKIGTLVL